MREIPIQKPLKGRAGKGSRSSPNPALSPEIIKSWRERQGLTTQELASLLSVSRITVERWEQWDSADPSVAKATPTGPAESILVDLIQSEDQKAQAERIKNAAQISAMNIGKATGGVMAGATIARAAALSVPLAGLGLAGFGLYQLLKKTWETERACPGCKTAINEQAKFCPECGARMA